MISPLRLIYLGLATLGAVQPVRQVLAAFSAHGAGLAGAWPAGLGLAPDMVIAAIALTVWIIAETAVRRNWLALIAIPATFAIAVSCGLPLYLFLRTRPVA